MEVFKCSVESCENEPQYKCNCQPNTLFCQVHFSLDKHIAPGSRHGLVSLCVMPEPRIVESVRSFIEEKLKAIWAEEVLILAKHSFKISEAEKQIANYLEKTSHIERELISFANELNNLRPSPRNAENDFFKALLASEDKAINKIGLTCDFASEYKNRVNFYAKFDAETYIKKIMCQNAGNIINQKLAEAEENLKKEFEEINKKNLKEQEEKIKKIKDEFYLKIQNIETQNSELKGRNENLTKKLEQISNIKIAQKCISSEHNADFKIINCDQSHCSHCLWGFYNNSLMKRGELYCEHEKSLLFEDVANLNKARIRKMRISNCKKRTHNACALLSGILLYGFLLFLAFMGCFAQIKLTKHY
ncbi:unnamed protein product [Blepharisma stoltei]|uniref:Uncharacterized protein n=1 Tax=Blepharisma stoltei TaxID=1481888 RepID=A0AAU9KPR7_9CILI|nr:unnamed protein product [Blepharisma stoltei]